LTQQKQQTNQSTSPQQQQGPANAWTQKQAVPQQKSSHQLPQKQTLKKQKSNNNGYELYFNTEMFDLPASYVSQLRPASAVHRLKQQSNSQKALSPQLKTSSQQNYNVQQPQSQQNKQANQQAQTQRPQSAMQRQQQQAQAQRPALQKQQQRQAPAVQKQMQAAVHRQQSPPMNNGYELYFNKELFELPFLSLTVFVLLAEYRG